MPELDAEHRNQMAEALVDLRVPNPLAEGPEWDIEMSGVYSWPELQRFADALAPLVVGWLADARAEELRKAADELAVDSSLTDCTKRPTEYADARDDERIDIVIWLRERTDQWEADDE